MASARNDHANTADPKSPDSGAPSNTEKDPSEWTTGDEPMTGAQASYLKTLAEQAHKPLPNNDKLTKAEASELIDELREKAGLED